MQCVNSIRKPFYCSLIILLTYYKKKRLSFKQKKIPPISIQFKQIALTLKRRRAKRQTGFANAAPQSVSAGVGRRSCTSSRSCPFIY